MSESTAPKPQAPLDPEKVLADLEDRETDQQISALEDLLGSLSQRLSSAQG